MELGNETGIYILEIQTLMVVLISFLIVQQFTEICFQKVVEELSTP